MYYYLRFPLALHVVIEISFHEFIIILPFQIELLPFNVGLREGLVSLSWIDI